MISFLPSLPIFPQTAQVECLGDLQGPKFRVGELAADPIELKNGDVLEFGICKAAWLQQLWQLLQASDKVVPVLGKKRCALGKCVSQKSCL